MQLLIIVLAAFGLGIWFSHSRAADRLAGSARGFTSRLRRKKSSNPEQAASEGVGSTSN